MNLNPLQQGDANPMDSEFDMFGDDVFPDGDLGQEMGNMVTGMEGMDFMDILNQGFDTQHVNMSPPREDRERQRSRTNDPHAVSIAHFCVFL